MRTLELIYISRVPKYQNTGKKKKNWTEKNKLEEFLIDSMSCLVLFEFPLCAQKKGK